MAYTNGLCPVFQQYLNDVFGSNAPELKYFKLGALQALNSSVNKSGFQQIELDPSQTGKQRQVQLLRVDPMCFDVAADAYPCDDYTDNIEPVPNHSTITLPAAPFTPQTSGGDPMRLKLDEWEMTKLCRDKDQFMMERVLAFLRRFEEGFNAAILGQIAAAVGEFADGTATKQVPLYANIGGVQNMLRSAQHTIMNSYMDILATGTPIMIGGSLLRNYNQDLAIACCNQQGINMQNSGEWYWFHDQMIDNEVGANNFFMLAPGAMQLVMWHQYKHNAFEKDGGNLWQRGTIVSPVTGLEYDLNTIYDHKCKAYFVEIQAYAQVVPVVAGSCLPDSPNVNSTLLFEACAQAETFTCEDIV